MAGPNLTRRQLGRRLRNLREQSGKRAADVEYAQIMSPSKLYRLEAGQNSSVSWPEVMALAQLYRADKDLERELIRMAKATLEAGWWEEFQVPKWFQLFVELEQIASAIYVYEVEFVTGLLQTEAYMRALYAVNQRLGTDAKNTLVASRLLRQREFWARTPPPRLEVVMSEGAVRRAIGGPHVHAEQRQALIDAAGRPHVSLYVIPDAVGAHPTIGRPFMLMEFPDDLDPSVVYSEAANGAKYDDSPAEFDHHRDTFEATRDMATALEEFHHEAFPVAQVEPQREQRRGVR
ncbi:helix-turn-helix transcriptional regulator [Phytomonospora sp. NPDC050363]|uniref:helix-turn-helix domain-containing protein n=1 Tax=Phytomonospora sp. NPDC050363 TaxID=3155642 RepID=UPI0033DBA665